MKYEGDKKSHSIPARITSLILIKLNLYIIYQ